MEIYESSPEKWERTNGAYVQEVSTGRRHLGQVWPGMDDKTRLEILTGVPGEVPTRHVKSNPDDDPFGLLEVYDTYEQYARTIYTQCEGIYNAERASNEKVAKQVKTQKQQDRKSVELSAVKLTELYSFKMTRSEDETGAAYHFRRAEAGYEHTGFSVCHNLDGHFVLKNIGLGETDTKTDAEYWRLLFKAEKYIQDYAAALHIKPDQLLALAEQNIDNFNPHKARVAHAKILGRKAMSVAGKGVKNALTVEVPEYRGIRHTTPAHRRPRVAVVLAAVMLIPTGAHSTVATSAVHGIVWTTKGNERKQASHEKFDARHLSLPANAVTVALGHAANVPYSGNYDVRLKGATPDFPGNATFGSIRRLTNLGFSGSNADAIPFNQCATIKYEAPTDDTELRIVNTDPGTGKSLRVSFARDKWLLCNKADDMDTLHSKDLKGVYVQLVRGKA